MQTVTAIDASLTHAAICGGDLERFWVKCYASKPNGPTIADRYARYEAHSRNLVNTVEVSRPDLILIEGYSFGSQGQSVIDLGELGACIRTKLLRIPVKTIEVAPSTIKQFATGNGNANKVKMVAALTKRYGVTFDSDDEYDAFALYRLGLVILGEAHPMTEFQRKAAYVAVHGSEKKKRKAKRK